MLFFFFFLFVFVLVLKHVVRNRQTVLTPKKKTRKIKSVFTFYARSWLSVGGASQRVVSVVTEEDADEELRTQFPTCD